MSVVLKSTKAGSLCFVLVAIVIAMHSVRGLGIHKEGEREAAVNKEMVFSNGNRTMMSLEKLLHPANDDGDRNRIGTSCSKQDIVIYQDQVPPLPSGIPQYAVQIMNKCASDCNIANIHVNCGMFSSARLINPAVFRRLRYGDCLVNGGRPLGPGRTISFQYANTYRYPLSVSSVTCL
ncbi:putative TPD1 protein-like protein 1-like [Sesbania bispinosa]|nr:putative TPD1 protein-like protein 1-like [Sesbania bispinosa]